MTITYDPHHPKYYDEADLREELTRVYDLCHGCRLCYKFCTSFPTLFEFIDAFEDQDAAKLTPAQQDQVVDECFGCKLCYINCPYIPGQSEWELDFPRLMLRAKQTRHRTEKRTVKDKLTDEMLGRTDAVGKVSTAFAPLANWATGKPGSFTRNLMAKTVGIASQRLLPPYAKQRFSTWFAKRARPFIDRPQGQAALFPTCLVEYQNPAIGQDLVKVYERNNVEVHLPKVKCCGAPWLHAGDVDRFVDQAKDNIAVLAAEVRAGRTVVVPQPTCGFVIKKDYVDYIGGPDAEVVAANTKDASEYLWGLRKGENTTLDTDFSGGTVPETISYHAPCHLRAQNVGLKGRDLLKLTGAKITLAEGCSGIDGSWGYREENYEIARKVARQLADNVTRQGAEVVAGECHLANGSIQQETGRVPQHPLQILARAYGIPEEPPR